MIPKSPSKTSRPLRDRADAGRRLARKLAAYAGREDLLVLGLARGGLPVAFPIAMALHAPLDVFLVRKLGVPGEEELAMGAIASGGVRVLNHDIVQQLGVSPHEIEAVAAQEQTELERRERLYRAGQPFPDVAGKTVILVDDGIATGATLRAAIQALRAHNPAEIVVAVGVAPPETCEQLAREVDELVCVLQPTPFWGVGLWFQHFEPTTDQKIQSLLRQAQGETETL